MAEVSKESILDKVSVAFRLAGEEEQFQQQAEHENLILSFQVERPGLAGTVTIKDGRISWGSGNAKAPDISIVWRDWPALESWARGRMPLWWSRIRRRVKIQGGWNPTFLECIYLFRYYLNMFLEKK